MSENHFCLSVSLQPKKVSCMHKFHLLAFKLMTHMNSCTFHVFIDLAK